MIKTKKSSLIVVIFIIISACVVMALVDLLYKPEYLVKSIIKIIVFIGLPIVYSVYKKIYLISDIFKIEKRSVIISLVLGLATYGVIFGAYTVTKNIIDYSNVTSSLMSDAGITKSNFLFVALYISFVNSLVEEFFFRGFAFLHLRKYVNIKWAYLISSLSFAVYHVSILKSWFELGFTLFLIFGLVVAGYFFNTLDSKVKSIMPSWFAHMFANFSINTIGFLLFQQ